LQTALMAGLGPDMFFLGINAGWGRRNHPIHAMATSGFLTDFHTLMAQCPRTSHDDFFIEALTAFEIAGGLYMFPASFGFRYVSVNGALPQQFIDRFAQYDRISINQLMTLYMDLMADYGQEFGYLNFGYHDSLMHPRFTMDLVMSNFIDFNTRTADFTNHGFISFLNNFAQIFQGWHPYLPRNVSPQLYSLEYLQRISETTVFHLVGEVHSASNALLTPETPVFLHSIPLADEQGRLILDPSTRYLQTTWAAFCIPTSGDGHLAWEFIQYIIPALSMPELPSARLDPLFGVPSFWGEESIATPIMRSLFENHSQRAFENIFINWQGGNRFGPMPQPLVGAYDTAERERQIQNATSRLAIYNEMPMTLSTSLLERHLFEEPMEEFLQGLITAEYMAQQLQNRIGLWLLE